MTNDKYYICQVRHTEPLQGSPICRGLEPAIFRLRGKGVSITLARMNQFIYNLGVVLSNSTGATIFCSTLTWITYTMCREHNGCQPINQSIIYVQYNKLNNSTGNLVFFTFIMFHSNCKVNRHFLR